MGRIGLKSGSYPLSSAEETVAFGILAARSLSENEILALSGDLGAGKTTFVQGLAKGLGILEPIQSPTFVFLNLYENLAHFDLYRLKNSSDFLNLGFDEYFGKKICAIEWSDRIPTLLPSETIYIHFAYAVHCRLTRYKIHKVIPFNFNPRFVGKRQVELNYDTVQEIVVSCAFFAHCKAFYFFCDFRCTVINIY